MTRVVSQARDSAQIEAVTEYIRRTDQLDFPAALFADDFRFFVPKFGVGQGLPDFMRMADGFLTAYRGITHAIDLIVEAGTVVVVEGTTSGEDAHGNRWQGGETPGGRFCSVFEFGAGGLIARMHIYLDPDYTAQDKPRLRWQRGEAARW